MENFQRLCDFSEKFLLENKININDNELKKVVTLFALHIEFIMFNIISMMSLIALLNASDKITDKTIAVGKQYIENNCNFKYNPTEVYGGSRLGCASYMGSPEIMYNADNSTENILNIDFSGDYARPQIGGSKKSNKMFSKIINQYINEIISYHGIKASKDMKKELYKIVAFHIECFKNILKSKKQISSTNISNIIKKHKILKPLM